MPRVVEYPHAPLKRALEVAQAVDELGGSTSVEMLADKLGKKVSGSFKGLVSATVKYGLLDRKRGQLSATGLYEEYKLAYDDQERIAVKRRAFLSVPLYQQLYDRFAGRKLPVGILDRMLAREFDVEQSVASRVAGYFVEGAKNAELLDGDILLPLESSGTATPDEAVDEPDTEDEHGLDGNAIGLRPGAPPAPAPTPEGFSIRIVGPGLDSTLELKEEDDLAILEAVLKKVRKRLAETASD